jgi:uncharacterized repeat protein (TIGR01451 family)
MHPPFTNTGSLFSKRVLAFAQWALCVLLLCSAGMVQAQLRPFGKAFQANAPGDILIIGNTITTCQTTAPAGAIATVVTAAATCLAARGGTAAAAANNNNSQGMINVDADPAAPGANSSTAGLTLPIGATVLWAGLYWGGDALATSARNQVNFKTPVAGYQALTADWLASNGTLYHAGKTVTSLISASGNYTAADIKTNLGLNAAGAATSLNGGFGGWSLVVVYQLNSEQFRNLTVFDGYQTTLPVTIPLSGFLTPSTGVVGAKVGLVTYEGDLGTTGDGASFNGVTLANGLNPANNFLNSSITRLGAQITDKNPNYVNQFGFDIDVVDAGGILPNGATNTTLVLSSSGDAFYPGVVTTAIDIFVPNLAGSLTKTVVDINGGVLNPGDTLTYSISFTNTGQDSATKVFVTDPIPVGTTFVPGTLRVVAGANAGTKTDAADADQAEFDSALNRVVFRLGAGANSTNGGSLLPGAGATITFQVRVNPGTNGQTITNVATINYTGTTLPTNYTANATALIGVVPAALSPLLTNQKTVQVVSDPVNGTSNPKNIPGAENLYTLTIQNTGSGAVDTNTLVIVDPIPANSELFTGNLTAGGPHTFTDGALPSGLTCPFVALASLTDCVDFSKDAGATWTYVPNGAYDPAVTHIRFRLSGAMNGDAVAGSPYPSFAVQFKTRVK